MTPVLARLSAGALGWLDGSLDLFDPYSAAAATATHPRAKAALELALLCSCSARLGDPAGGRLDAATGVVRAIWRRPEFLGLLGEDPDLADGYRLIYAALAPEGCDEALRRAALARLSPALLSPADKTPYQRLEIRYYADRVGVRHGIESYPRLIEQSRMVRPPAVPPAPETPAQDPDPDPARDPFTLAEAYAVTHSGFYLGDFGRNRSALTGDRLDRARALVAVMLEHGIRHEQWDLAAELVITQFVLGIEPLDDARGAAAVRRLAEVQLPDGALPGRSPELSSDPSTATTAEFFAAAYHTTLVTAMMALILDSGGRS